MAWLDTIFKFIGHARRNTVTPSVTNGSTSELQCDEQGRLLVNTSVANKVWSHPPTASSAKEASRIVKASSGVLYSFVAYNANASKRWLQFFNSTTVPSNGALPRLVVPIEADGIASGGFESMPFATGLVWALSTTEDTLTIASADCIASVEYV